MDDLGLGPALEWLAQGVAERTKMAVAVDVSGGRLPPAVETAIYRIAQEALTNAVRHARAKRAHIQVHAARASVQMVVRDDGQGFDVEAALGRRGDRGLGLIGIRQRVQALGGTLGMRSNPGQGTELSVTIPLEGTA